MAYRNGEVWVNRSRVVLPLNRPRAFGASAFAEGMITDYLAAGNLPCQARVRDPFGYASGALAFDLELPAGAHRAIDLAIPFYVSPGARSASVYRSPQPTSVAEQFSITAAAWDERLRVPAVALPAAAQDFVNAGKTAVAHILVDRDGPALQPGPRRYTRSWIRDGALMVAALLRRGCLREAEAFVRWYATYQAADGNVPCCVGRGGPDWLPEHDSHGELIFAIMECFRFSRDHNWLVDLWPVVRKAVDYIETLRSQRLAAQYRTPAKRCCYGLLPESVSHARLPGPSRSRLLG